MLKYVDTDAEASDVGRQSHGQPGTCMGTLCVHSIAAGSFRPAHRAVSAGGWMVMLFLLGAGPSAEASFTASITSANPFVWGDYARTFASFEVSVTNTGLAADAYEIAEVQKPAGLTA